MTFLIFCYFLTVNISFPKSAVKTLQECLWEKNLTFKVLILFLFGLELLFFCFVSLEFVLGFFIKSKVDSFFSFWKIILSEGQQGFIFWVYFYFSLTPSPVVFPKMCFSKKGWSPGFLRINIIISHIFPENLFRKFEDFLLQY